MTAPTKEWLACAYWHCKWTNILAHTHVRGAPSICFIWIHLIPVCIHWVQTLLKEREWINLTSTPSTRFLLIRCKWVSECLSSIISFSLCRLKILPTHESLWLEHQIHFNTTKSLIWLIQWNKECNITPWKYNTFQNYINVTIDNISVSGMSLFNLQHLHPSHNKAQRIY